MKRLLLGMLAIMMLVMSGCGDSTVAVVVPFEPVVDPPSITSYRFTQDRVAEFIDGSVDFFAPDSDIDTMTVVVIDNFNGSVISRVISFPNFPNTIQGTIPFSIDYLSFPNGTFTFSIFLTDFNGNTSNQAVDTFRVP